MSTKLCKKVSDRLGKVKPFKPKRQKSPDEKVAQKVRKRFGGGAYERTPEADTYTVSVKKQPKKEKPDLKNRLGNFMIRDNEKLAVDYLNDLRALSREVPEVSFYEAANKSSVKSLKSTLDKLLNRSELFAERGFFGVVRDGVRATIFMPDADKNYPKVIKAMANKKYKVDKIYAEDANEFLIFNKDGTFKMIDDVDVRFGKNARPSGYQDVQMRFRKGKHIYELLILPGPNSLMTKNLEHEQVYELFRAYETKGFKADAGAKEIIKGIQNQFFELTKKLYYQALQKDVFGAKNNSEAVTFTKENVNTVNKLLKSLKALYRGKFEALSPSKRSASDFKQTKNYKQLNNLEHKVREVMDFYKPIEQ